jgi:hypothetical protein
MMDERRQGAYYHATAIYLLDAMVVLHELSPPEDRMHAADSTLYFFVHQGGEI